MAKDILETRLIARVGSSPDHDIDCGDATADTSDDHSEGAVENPTEYASHILTIAQSNPTDQRRKPIAVPARTIDHNEIGLRFACKASLSYSQRTLTPGDHMFHESETSERMSWGEVIKCASGTEADRHNQYRMLKWMAAWGVSFVGGTALLRSDELSSGWKWAVPSLAAILGVAAMLAYLKFLREADELARKIQFDGIAFAFGVGILLTVGYQMFEWAGAPVLELSTVATIMLVAFSVGQINAMRRYR